MEWRKSYNTEILIMVLAGLAGAMIYTLDWIGFIGGLVIILLTSYFLTSKLKEQTVKEYLNKIKVEKE